jgi:PLP dependent protein
MVAEQLAGVKRRMVIAAERAGRNPADVTLVAVSKGHTAADVMEAYAAGHRDFGENRAGEMAAKVPQLPDDIRWHFIGSLQTRQAKVALPHTDLLHSLDRPRLINAWAAGSTPAPTLLQVNIAAEPQKHGVAPDAAADLLNIVGEAGIDCVGLMCIPPQVIDPEDNRSWFVRLRRLRNELAAEFPRLTELSMGMTDDYEVAIEEGATLIRVGRAIFGAPGYSGKD